MLPLPASANMEKAGSQVNSGRRMQWMEPTYPAPGDYLSTGAMVTQLMRKLQAMYKKDGGAMPDGILNLRMNYLTADGKEFDTLKVTKRINGDFEQDTKIGDKTYKKGQPAPGFGLL